MEALKENETENVDWDKSHADNESPVLIIAPHGGSIEPHTDIIATAIGGDNFNLFIFRGLRRKNKDPWLHVTSTKYEEDDLMPLQKKSQIALAVHGAANREGYAPLVTFMGGGNEKYRDLISARLHAYGFATIEAPSPLNGSTPTNLVNRCGPGQNLAGIQLEISRGERDALADNPARLARYAKAVREVLLPMHESAKTKSDQSK